MYVARMKFSSGTCCATGEMWGFQMFEPEWFGRKKRYGYKEPLADLIDYSDYRKMLKDNGFTRFNDFYFGKGETAEEAWTNCLKGVQQQVDGYSYEGQQLRYFWFVRYDPDEYDDVDDKYQNDELRQIVQKLPNVVKLGEYVNANTKNFVDGYMVAFNKED